MKNLIFAFISLFSLFAFSEDGEKSSGSILDRSALTLNVEKNLSHILPDINVVSKRSYDKSSSLLFHTALSIDYSDSPLAYDAFGFGFGYATESNLEFNFNYYLGHTNSVRTINDSVAAIDIGSGQKASITAPKAQSGMELNLIYNFLYGKESWGPESVLRFETFLKFGYRTISYDAGVSGDRIMLQFGKTLLLSPGFNLRASIGPSTISYYVNGSKFSSMAALFELGTISYF